MAAVNRELLEKFWRGLCTEDEVAAVEAYFQQHPEDDTLMDEYETADEGLPLPEGYSEEMFAAITSHTEEKGRRRKSIQKITAWMSAASFILIAGAIYLLHHTKKEEEKHVQEAVAWIGKHNVDTKKVRVQLPDSTETILSPGATIRYRKDFGLYNMREVKVEGQVVFSVHKNKQIPFIVYSGGVTTTVLGTIFEVTDEKDSDQIRVRLLQGKVMVSVDSLLTDSSHPYFLAPGEEFVYGKWNKSIVVRDFREHNSGTYAVHRVNRLPGRPDTLFNWYMFNNQGLADVFDQLSILYNVEIQYSSIDLHNRYFIGKLTKKDSLMKIMKDIALLNRLSVTEHDGAYVVRKHRP